MLKVKSNVSGFSIIELLVSIVILAAMVFLGRVGVGLVNSLFQASNSARVQQEAQSVLYSVTKDVRNCQKIVWASSGTLVLRVFNTKPGYDLVSNPGLFDPVNVATLTYTYTKIGTDSYLQRTLEKGGTILVQDKYLRNILLEPDTTNYMFNVCKASDFSNTTANLCPPLTGDPTVDAPIPYFAVDIRLRMSPSFTKNVDILYSTKETRRTES